MLLNKHPQRFLLIILCLHLVGLSALASRFPNVNLLKNGGFEQKEEVLLVIEPEDYLPATAILGGSGGMGVSLPAELEQWGFLSFGTPKALPPGTYIMEVQYYGSDYEAPKQTIHVFDGAHRTACDLPVEGDGKLHIVRQQFSTNSPIGELILKKSSAGTKPTNPIDQIKIISADLGWGKLIIPGSRISWQIDQQTAHGDSSAALLKDYFGGSGGWISNYIPIGQQEFQLNGWCLWEEAEEVIIEAGIAWYSEKDSLLSKELFTINKGPANSWQQFSFTSKPPKQARLARVIVQARKLEGAVWFDDIALFGDPTVLTISDPLTIRMWGKMGIKTYYRPEEGAVGLNRLELWSNMELGPQIQGEITLAASWEGDKPFSAPGQVFNLNMQQARIQLGGKPWPAGPDSNIILGTLNIEYSPYIATLGYNWAGGWMLPAGVQMQNRWARMQSDIFSVWQKNSQIAGAKLRGNLLGTQLAFVGIGVWDHFLIERSHGTVWQRGSLKEKAFSLEGKRTFDFFTLDCTYSIMSGLAAEQPDMWRFNLESAKLFPGLKVAYETWYAHPDFDPMYHNKSPRGYDMDYERFTEGNWLDNHRGQKGHRLDFSFEQRPLQVRSGWEFYRLLGAGTTEANIERTKLNMSANLALAKSQLFALYEQRQEVREQYELIELHPFWQRTEMGLERQMGQISGWPVSFTYKRVFEKIYQEEIAANEVLLTRAKGENKVYLGYRWERKGTERQNYFKLGGLYVTPGGIQLKLIFTTPNLPHTGYFDPLRERWIEVDNELRISAMVGF